MTDLTNSSEMSLARKTPEFAGFGVRALASLLDTFFVTLLGFLAGIFIGFAYGVAKNYGYSDDTIKTVAGVCGVCLGLSYEIYFPASWWQATPGKRVMKIFIQKPDGARLTLLNSLGRFFARYLSAIIFGIGYLMVIWTKEKTALHDLLANTRVVYGRK